eukprot:UN3255
MVQCKGIIRAGCQSPSSLLRNGVLEGLRRTDRLRRDVDFRLGLLSRVERVDLAEPVQIRESRLHVGLDEVARIELDLDEVLPRQGVVLVPDVGHARVHLLGDVCHDVEGNFQLLLLGAHGDALQGALPVEQGDGGVHLGDGVDHCCKTASLGALGARGGGPAGWDATRAQMA